MGILDGLLMAIFRKPISKAVGAIPKEDAKDAIARLQKAIDEAREREADKKAPVRPVK